MRELEVHIEINGTERWVGSISGSGSDDAVFAYYDRYLSAEDSAPISLNLPLREEPFSVIETRIFFEGLLPEGFMRKSVAGSLRVDESDYLSLLRSLGNECLGAIRVVSGEDNVPEARYSKLNIKQISALAAEGATKSAELVSKARLSLTGASGKVGLYYDSNKNEWYLPSGDAPSTHIVKQSHVRFDEIVVNEQLSLRTAARLGIDVPDSFIINIGNGEDKDILFATQRYDRVLVGNRMVSRKKCPLRLHQEDLGQAMGIPPINKYEEKGGNYFAKMVESIRAYSLDPIRDITKLWDLTVFNSLIGNTDNHIKNHSLLYSPDLKSIALAPAYDIVSTVVYGETVRDMAFGIGGVYRLEDLDLAAWRREARKIGLGEKYALDRVEHLSNGFRKAIKESAEELADSGFENAVNLSRKILRKAANKTKKK